jgi:hypothetical protein
VVTPLVIDGLPIGNPVLERMEPLALGIVKHKVTLSTDMQSLRPVYFQVANASHCSANWMGVAVQPNYVLCTHPCTCAGVTQAT